ncbi:hypothetical protein FB451DRAFT_65159 [Mycena latifolia]|nr:hypothetical protein FB451DRAFT_65159 [Mycena latifolia]
MLRRRLCFVQSPLCKALSAASFPFTPQNPDVVESATRLLQRTTTKAMPGEQAAVDSDCATEMVETPANPDAQLRLP